MIGTVGSLEKEKVHFDSRCELYLCKMWPQSSLSLVESITNDGAREVRDMWF